MQNFFIEMLNQYGYLAVALLIAVENIFPPIPSEVILAFGGFMTTYTSMNVWLVALFATHRFGGGGAGFVFSRAVFKPPAVGTLAERAFGAHFAFENQRCAKGRGLVCQKRQNNRLYLSVYPHCAQLNFHSRGHEPYEAWPVFGPYHHGYCCLEYRIGVAGAFCGGFVGKNCRLHRCLCKNCFGGAGGYYYHCRDCVLQKAHTEKAPYTKGKLNARNAGVCFFKKAFS